MSSMSWSNEKDPWVVIPFNELLCHRRCGLYQSVTFNIGETSGDPECADVTKQCKDACKQKISEYQ